MGVYGQNKIAGIHVPVFAVSGYAVRLPDFPYAPIYGVFGFQAKVFLNPPGPQFRRVDFFKV
jgi:hypothetical protein